MKSYIAQGWDGGGRNPRGGSEGSEYELGKNKTQEALIWEPRRRVIKHDLSIGVYGLDFSAELRRPGS